MRFRSLALWLLLLSATVTFSGALDLDAVRKRLPETITPLTEAQLTKDVPLSYYFNYDGFPQPGKRVWKRVDANTWHEIYPDGYTSEFKVLGHTTIKGISGTIVVKIVGDPEQTDTSNDGSLQAFIPDKGSQVMHHWYRNSSRGDSDWNDLAEMKEVK